jgi:hypothetical protein
MVVVYVLFMYKFSLPVIKHHSVKACGAVEIYLHPFVQHLMVVSGRRHVPNHFTSSERPPRTRLGLFGEVTIQAIYV